MSMQGTAYVGNERFQRSMSEERRYTIEDIYNLPENVRVELIEGRIFNMAPPVRIHQEILSDLTVTIGSYIKSKSGKCKIYPAPFGVRLFEDEETYVEPDISVICDIDKLDDKGCLGAPDWIIEIISPSTQNMDYFIKMFKYREAGVREYWIVDSTKQRVQVYLFEKQEIAEYSFGDSVASDLYPELCIDFSEYMNI